MTEASQSLSVCAADLDRTTQAVVLKVCAVLIYSAVTPTYVALEHYVTIASLSLLILDTIAVQVRVQLLFADACKEGCNHITNCIKNSQLHNSDVNVSTSTISQSTHEIKIKLEEVLDFST